MLGEQSSTLQAKLLEVKGIMARKPRRKLLFTILFITLLTISAYAFPRTLASEPTLQQKGANILGNVVGLDLAQYSISTKNQQDSSASYLGVVSQESIVYDLTSNGNSLKALCTFANGNLQIIQIIENQGTPSMTKAASANPVDLAKDFLDSYQTYTANPLFSELKSTLNGIDQNINVTKSSGNTMLEVTNYNGYTSFRWHYVANGVSAEYSKFIALVYRDGFLSGFVDNWQFYNVGNTTVNLSKDEALSIALDAVKAHVSYLLKYGLDLNNINESNIRWASLIFDSSLSANNTRSKDPLELYPVWRVGVALDKWYGSMYGVQVDIWADTKQVRSIEDAWSTMPPPDGTPTSNMSTTGEETTIVSEQTMLNFSSNQECGNSNMVGWVTVSTSIVFLAVSVVLYRQKSAGFPFVKRRYLRIGGKMACVMILCVMLLAPVATVSAESNNGAIIWGSESKGANGYNEPGGPSWRKHSNEAAQQRLTASHIDNILDNAGYLARNNQGDNGTTSYKGSVELFMQIYTTHSSRMIYVDFDHGNGNDIYYDGEYHFLFEDQNGTYVGTVEQQIPARQNGIYDCEIYPKMSNGTTVLAFISTCNSASTVIPGTQTDWQGYGTYGAKGMPYAFTHGRTVKDLSTPGFNIASDISRDGYFYPDDGCQAFLGFVMGSASLTQLMPYENGVNYYSTWMEKFFRYAVMDDTSINCALSQASYELYGKDFGNPTNPLRNFTAYWWMAPGHGFTTTGYGSLVIYGNGRVELRSFNDDFEDQNYNNWTVALGSWSASAYHLSSLQGYSLIRTNQQFTSDRFVRATVQTTNPGSNSWDVAWLMAKYVDANNQVYGLIHKNGNVELCIWKNGQQTVYTATDSLDTTQPHRFDINIVGTTARIWIDGFLKRTVTNEYLDDFGGYVALYTPYSVTADFDDISVVQQPYWPPAHTLTVISTSGGTVSPGTWHYLEGTWATQTAEPDPIYFFDHWTKDDQPAGSDPTINVLMNGDHTLRAYFRPANYYTLTISCSGQGSTTPSAGEYPNIMEGTYYLVTAEPQSGYIFHHWELEEQNRGIIPSIAVHMDGDKTLEAFFAPQPSYRFISDTIDYNPLCDYPENIIGWCNDNQEAIVTSLGGGNYYGFISGRLNAQATGGGDIQVYSYGSGVLHVFVKNNINDEWTYVSTQDLPESPTWIDCGTYESSFNYIKLQADPDLTHCFYIDSVCVEPLNPGTAYVSVSATADVATTESAYYTCGTSPIISWVCADDYGSYYCYITEVIVDGISHDPTDYGSENEGSIQFSNIQSDHTVVVHSAPYYYPVTFNVYAHNDYFGDAYVTSWTEYHVAWEERDGPVYSHGSDLHGGGAVEYYIDSSIEDPWEMGYDYFDWAIAYNWGGGSESYYYSIPLDVYTFVWGNTVDIWYNWQGWYGMGDMPSNTAGTGIPGIGATIPTFPEGFTPPASTPYIYDSTTDTYIPVR
jgi:hypothetical protein